MVADVAGQSDGHRNCRAGQGSSRSNLGLWWRLPRHQPHKLDVQIHDPKARADVEDNFRETVGQALGGAAVLICAVAAYLQVTLQQQASYDLLISNQVSKSFEQLGSQEAATRLGGIYGLKASATPSHVADEHPASPVIKDRRPQVLVCPRREALRLT